MERVEERKVEIKTRYALKKAVEAMRSCDRVQMYGPADAVRDMLSKAILLCEEALSRP